MPVTGRRWVTCNGGFRVVRNWAGTGRLLTGWALGCLHLVGRTGKPVTVRALTGLELAGTGRPVTGWALGGWYLGGHWDEWN